MLWTVPKQIKLTMVHSIENRREPGLTRFKTRDTTRVVQRPEHGESQVTVECGYCGREGVFTIQDAETTKALRRGQKIRSLITAAVFLTSVPLLWLLFSAHDSGLNLTLAFLATMFLLPFGLGMAFVPSGKIGVEAPETIQFDEQTRHEGFSTVRRGTRRRDGLSCGGQASPA